MLPSNPILVRPFDYKSEKTALFLRLLISALVLVVALRIGG